MLPPAFKVLRVVRIEAISFAPLATNTPGFSPSHLAVANWCSLRCSPIEAFLGITNIGFLYFSAVKIDPIPACATIRSALRNSSFALSGGKKSENSQYWGLYSPGPIWQKTFSCRFAPAHVSAAAMSRSKASCVPTVTKIIKLPPNTLGRQALPDAPTG